MQATERFEQKVNLFMNFIQIDDAADLRRMVTSFFTNVEETGDKQVIYDRGQLMMVRDGKLVDEFITSDRLIHDRIVSFDGWRIMEINPYSYVTPLPIQMKGDSSGRRRSSGDGGISSNNNNNNNNG
jgi:hypothetical protein